MIQYQFFGSENSIDIDVMFFVEVLPADIQGCRALCNELTAELQSRISPHTKINANVSVLEDGRIVAIFKGIIDESNNALYHTYGLHSQYFPPLITQLLPRDIETKLLRTARVLLSFLTKTASRSDIKKALQGDFTLKLAALRALQLTDYETETSLGNTNTIPDFQKTFAFQIGQTLALMEGREYYTKNEITYYLPDLQPYLYREAGISNVVLQQYLSLFLTQATAFLPQMQRLYE